MFVLSTIVLILAQAVLGEFLGESALLLRLWLLPVVAIAVDTKRLRLLPIVFIGLLVDGLFSAPTGFHVLELGIVYASLSLSIEHLGYRTLTSRIVLGVFVGILSLIVHVALGHIFSTTAQADYLLAHLIEFVLTQIAIIVVCFPVVYKVLVAMGSTEQRLNVDRGNP